MERQDGALDIRVERGARLDGAGPLGIMPDLVLPAVDTVYGATNVDAGGQPARDQGLPQIFRLLPRGKCGPYFDVAGERLHSHVIPPRYPTLLTSSLLTQSVAVSRASGQVSGWAQPLRDSSA